MWVGFKQRCDLKLAFQLCKALVCKATRKTNPNSGLMDTLKVTLAMNDGAPPTPKGPVGAAAQFFLPDVIEEEEANEARAQQQTIAAGSTPSVVG